MKSSTACLWTIPETVFPQTYCNSSPSYPACIGFHLYLAQDKARDFVRFPCLSVYRRSMRRFPCLAVSRLFMRRGYLWWLRHRMWKAGVCARCWMDTWFFVAWMPRIIVHIGQSRCILLYSFSFLDLDIQHRCGGLWTEWLLGVGGCLSPMA